MFTLTIATFVTIADKVLAAYLYTMSKELGPYVPLIIVNCLIISRCEICASKQSVPVAIADAVGMSLGFALALASIATVRELLGSGTWFGLPVSPRGDLASVGRDGPAAGGLYSARHPPGVGRVVHRAAENENGLIENNRPWKPRLS